MIGHGFKVKKYIVSDDVDEVPRVEFVEGDFSVTETGAPEVPVCVQLLDNPSAVIIAFINSLDETATGEPELSKLTAHKHSIRPVATGKTGSFSIVLPSKPIPLYWCTFCM